MRQKAVLISFRSINGINAETTATRWHNLKYLHNHLNNVETDLNKWRIPYGALKPTMNWQTDWSEVDDARLLVGVWKHGFGSWDAIQNVS